MTGGLTHLDADRWPELLAWLRDRLRPGGVLVVTTHGAEVARRLDAGDTYGLTPDAAAALRGCHRATGFGYAAYPWDAAYGVSLSSVDWVRATVAAMRGLELVSLHEAAWAGHQDVVALLQPLVAVVGHLIVVHRTEEERSRGDQRLEALLSSLSDGVLFLDDDRRIVFVNDALRHMFHLTEDTDELRGRSAGYVRDRLRSQLDDPEAFAKQVQAVCDLYLEAPALAKEGVRVVSTDEKTGLQALERERPSLPMKPGLVERREVEYVRHGVRCLTANLEVATGKILAPTISVTRDDERAYRDLQAARDRNEWA